MLLLVEVADSTPRYDRAVKLPLYARAGIGEVWIVDLRRRVVDVHRTPAGDGYADRGYDTDRASDLACAGRCSRRLHPVSGQIGQLGRRRKIDQSRYRRCVVTVSSL